MPFTRSSRRRGLAAAVVATLAIGGCGAGDGGNGVAGEHDDADVTFASMMIPHHRQAITMSRLAATHAAAPQVRELAGQIDAEQVPEIVQMQTMLATWGDDTDLPALPADHHSAGGDHTDDDHTDGDMPGMATDAQLAELTRANGPEFDRDFLELMIRHHQGAVAMARTELADGRDPDALTMARNISDAQEAAIALMQRLRSAG